MRRLGACCLFLLMIAAPTWSQPAGTPTSGAKAIPDPLNEPGLTPEEKNLRIVLNNWLVTMRKMDNFSANVKQEIKNLTTDKVTVMEGRVGIIKREDGKEVIPQAYLDMWLANEAKLSDDKRSVIQRVIFTTQGMYFYESEKKEILTKRLRKDEIDENLLFRMLNGMDLGEALRTFKFTLHKLDEWTAYIDIEPINKAQAAEFKKAQIAIAIKNYNPPEKPNVAWMPRRLVYSEAGLATKQITILLDELTPNNARISKDPFTPTMINGWKQKELVQQVENPKNLEDTRKVSPNFKPKQ